MYILILPLKKMIVFFLKKGIMIYLFFKKGNHENVIFKLKFILYLIAETGDQDQKCGVHAFLPFTFLISQWCELDYLCSHPF